ncbi:ComEA family DNA-binding protein [Hydrogenophaga sp.]|uniref:ComEA family DNA-binding protein n=1 Tax=Hydrogenophaga sp. TaxID=1904254 RepID=UPI003F6B948A
MLKKTLAALLALFAAAAFAAVDVNEASVADLDSIKGIGPGTSAKIVEQRKAAKFKDWDDLVQRVSGIGDKRAAKLSAEGLTVGGAPYKASDKKAVAVKTPKAVAAAEKAPELAPIKK